MKYYMRDLKARQLDFLTIRRYWMGHRHALAGRMTEIPPSAPSERPAMFTPEEVHEFKTRVTPLIGFQLAGFKQKQLERRLSALMIQVGVSSLSAYFDYLVAEPGRIRALVNGLTINVSEFFRDADKFEELARDVLPSLLARFERLRIWSAGCSMGAELYSVGMILDELGALDRCELVGTDLDSHILQRAVEGLYPAAEVRELSTERLERYFERAGALYRFKGDRIRERCSFRVHNLFQDPVESGWHLIMCRNVVIYFNDEQKKRLFQAFHQGLEPGGVYFVGRSERVLEYQKYGYRALAPFFYQRPADV